MSASFFKWFFQVVDVHNEGSGSVLNVDDVLAPLAEPLPDRSPILDPVQQKLDKIHDLEKAAQRNSDILHTLQQIDKEVNGPARSKDVYSSITEKRDQNTKQKMKKQQKLQKSRQHQKTGMREYVISPKG